MRRPNALTAGAWAFCSATRSLRISPTLICEAKLRNSLRLLLIGWFCAKADVTSTKGAARRRDARMVTSKVSVDYPSNAASAGSFLLHAEHAPHLAVRRLPIAHPQSVCAKREHQAVTHA